MKTVFGFIVGAILLAMPLQTVAQELTPEQIAQIEAEVLEWGKAWADGWEPENRCDIISALHHPDYVVRFSGGEPQRRDGWLEYCEGNMANWVSFSGIWSEMEVRVISPDAAVLIARYDGTWEYADGTTGHYPTGAHMILVERTSDGWGATIFQNFSGPRAEG